MFDNSTICTSADMIDDKKYIKASSEHSYFMKQLWDVSIKNKRCATFISTEK